MSRVCIALAALFFISSISPAATTRLHYRMSLDPQETKSGSNYQRLFSRPPKDLAERPVTILEKPVFGRAVARRFLVLDSTDKSGATYDIVWVDVNGDGKWQDSEKFQLSRMSGANSGQLSAIVPIEFPTDDGVTLQHFIVSAQAYRSSGRGAGGSAYSKSAGYYTGVVSFGDKQHKIALVDANSSGSFVDVPTKEDQGDKIFIDRNDDGKFSLGDDDNESTPFAAIIGVDGTFWHVAAALDGSSISIAKADLPMGKLTVKEADVSLVLTGEQGDLDITRAAGEQDFLVPVGVWQIKSATVRRADDQKRVWTLRSGGGTGQHLNISEDRPASVILPSELTWLVESRANENTVYARVVDSGSKLHFQLSAPDGNLRMDARAADGSWNQTLHFSNWGRGRMGAHLAQKGTAKLTPQLQGCPFTITPAEIEIDLK